jgi:hypothetical protein
MMPDLLTSAQTPDGAGAFPRCLASPFFGVLGMR